MSAYILGHVLHPLVVDYEFVRVVKNESHASHDQVGPKYCVAHVDGMVLEHQEEHDRDKAEGAYSYEDGEFHIDHIDDSHVKDHSECCARGDSGDYACKY